MCFRRRRAAFFVGYRGFDVDSITPVYPFGHGLSYTNFDYSDMQAYAAGDVIKLTLKDRIPEIFR